MKRKTLIILITGIVLAISGCGNQAAEDDGYSSLSDLLTTERATGDAASNSTKESASSDKSASDKPALDKEGVTASVIESTTASDATVPSQPAGLVSTNPEDPTKPASEASTKEASTQETSTKENSANMNSTNSTSPNEATTNNKVTVSIPLNNMITATTKQTEATTSATKPAETTSQTMQPSTVIVYQYVEPPSYAYTSHFFSNTYHTGNNLVFSPREIYFADGSLHAIMYIYNGHPTWATNIHDVYLSFDNGQTAIATATFGSLNDLNIAPYCYVLWEFTIPSNGVFLYNTNLNNINTTYRSSYTY